MAEFVENRRAQRLDVDMSIELYDLTNNKTMQDGQKFPAEVMNISKTGICFSTENVIEPHTFYRASMNFPTKESIDVIIEVLRVQIGDNGENVCGGAFVGISESDMFKIEVFRLFEEKKKEE